MGGIFMKSDKQTIKCDVYDCCHCDEKNECCCLDKIKVCNCSGDNTKEATMCDSFKAKED